MESCWRHPKILVYLIFGSPTLGQMLLAWIMAEEYLGQDMYDYCFPSSMIEMKNYVEAITAPSRSTRVSAWNT